MFQISVPADEKIDGFPYLMPFEDEGGNQKNKEGFDPQGKHLFYRNWRLPLTKCKMLYSHQTVQSFLQ